MSLEYERVVPQGANVFERTWRRVRAVTVSVRRLIGRLALPIGLIVASVLIYLFLLNPIEEHPKDPLQAVLFVLELMTLEAAEDLPQHPAIILFWLVMPILGLLVLGSVVEAILFSSGVNFNQEQRDLWEEAMASTFRNHIIIYDLNDLSRYVIEELSRRNYPMVVVTFELSPIVDNWLSRKGIPSIVRSPLNIRDALEKAAVRYARALLITTSDESPSDIDMNEVNTIIARHARELNPDLSIIARIKDPTYARLLERKHVHIVPSVSELAVWPFIGAVYDIAISQPIIVREDGLESEANFIVEMVVKPDSLLTSMQVYDLEEDAVDVMLHRPKGQASKLVIPPPGVGRMAAGDDLIIFAQQHILRHLISLNKVAGERLCHVIVAGMNSLGLYITSALLNIGVHVHTMDSVLNAEQVAEQLASMRRGRNGGVHLGHESGPKWLPKMLTDAAIDEAQALVICSSRDPENLHLAFLAQEMVGPDMRMVIRIGRDSYRELYKELDIDARLYRLSQVGAGPFFDVAVGAEVSPIEFAYDNRTYQLLTLKVTAGLLTLHPTWNTIISFQQATQTDVVLLHKMNEPTDVHPEHHRLIEPGDTIVVFGDVTTMRRIVEANR